MEIIDIMIICMIDLEENKMARIIVYDFEIFKYDSLIGAKILEDDGTERIFQTWDKEEIRDFYNENKNSIWIGHNSSRYDDCILQAIIEDKKSILDFSKVIVEKEILNVAAM